MGIDKVPYNWEGNQYWTTPTIEKNHKPILESCSLLVGVVDLEDSESLLEAPPRLVVRLCTGTYKADGAVASVFTNTEDIIEGGIEVNVDDGDNRR